MGKPKKYCQKWDLNPRPHTRTRILTNFQSWKQGCHLESGALDHSAILTELVQSAKFHHYNLKKQIRPSLKKILAERSFDLRTSGLWAQHASTAPLCYHAKNKQILYFNNIKQKKIWHGGPYWVEKSKNLFVREKLFEKNFCQKWDSNPRPQKWTATWTQRLRPLGHPDIMKNVSKMWGVSKL